jgi:hypothetical protein
MLRDHRNESRFQRSKFELHEFLGRCPRLSMSCARWRKVRGITNYCGELVWSASLTLNTYPRAVVSGP